MAMKKAGFTLIELLVAMAILATVGVVTANLFFQTLKGTTKAELLKGVKQEGDFAISIMEKMIRNAKEVQDVSSVCDGSNRSNITIRNPDNSTTIFNCSMTGSDTYIASNSARLTSNKVRVSSCSLIRCTRSGSAPPVVEIRFSLSQLGSPARPEEQAAVNFQTTVSLRNY